jgi:hypothetical protein
VATVADHAHGGAAGGSRADRLHHKRPIASAGDAQQPALDHVSRLRILLQLQLPDRRVRLIHTHQRVPAARNSLHASEKQILVAFSCQCQCGTIQPKCVG